MTTSKISHYIAVLFLVSLVSSAAIAQATQYDKATPPQHAAGLSSVGSYMSTELGNVNLSNGSLNLKIPIGTVGGRGFSIPIALNYSSKVWSASMDTDVNQQSVTQPVAYADYDRGGDWKGFWDTNLAGWSVGGVPMLMARKVRVQEITSGPCVGGYSYLLTKLTLKMPDGGEVEFRDDLYDGAPLPTGSCGSSAASRGLRWHATDGSGLIFINDSDNGVANENTSGVVITRDGTRYRFVGELCTSITDRNGNQITIGYFTQPTEVRYTDQLGRITTIKQNVPDPNNPSITLPILVTFPGYQGSQRYLKIKSGVMNQNYRSDIAPTLPVITGDWDPLSRGYAWPANTTRLFNKSYGMYAYQIDDLDVLTEVVLPDNRSLSFRYNKFGEVAQVGLPTGGTIQYDYSYQPGLPSGVSPVFQTGTNGTGGGILTDVKQIDRAVVESRTYPDGTTLEGKWNYIYGAQSVSGVNYPCTEVTARSNTDELLQDQRHFFLTASQYSEAPISGNHDGTHYALWSTGVEWRTESRDGLGNVLAASEQDWNQRAPVSWPTYQQEQPAKDNRVKETRRYLETGTMAKVETFYDQYNNPTEVKEYDYDQTLKRRTVTSYVSTNNSYNYQTDDSIHLLSLPAAQTIYDGSGTQKAQTVTEYDVYVNDGNRDLLTNYASVSQHDSGYGATKTTRGNPTRTGVWLNSSGTFIYSYPRYDVLGNVVSAKDARGNVSMINFADDFGNGSNPGSTNQNPATPTYALPTLITSPPPLPGAPVQIARSQYDYATGLLTGFRDRNSVITQTIYNDPFNRPTQINSALGESGVENRTLLYYAPAITPFGITLTNNDVMTVKDQATLNDGNLRSWTVTDGFGRTKETWSRDPLGDVKVATIYDGLGRARQGSNPFRPSAGESGVYTTSSYDLLGRIIAVTTPDGAVVTTSYSGETITVTDQAGNARKSVTDALGRLVKVVEDPNPGGLNFETTYNYDTLDNLVNVIQGSQQRFFMYDSLKRLIRARNPEQATLNSLNLSDPVTGNSAWSYAYQYDAGSNLIQKTDARGTVSTYVYDALNRNTSVDYSDTAINPDVKRFYDGATKGIGRIWYSYKGDETSANNVEQTRVDSYDGLGRPLVQQQSFKLNNVWKPYPVSRTYNVSGGVLTQTYPSVHSVSYSFDSAGRTTSFSGNLGGDTRTYATGITYSSWGSIGREQFGADTLLYQKKFYNIRGQLFDTRLSSVNDTWDWNRGRLLLYYSGNHQWGQSGSDNNGNVRFAETWIPPETAGLDQVDTLFEESYSYDSLNRLTSITDQKMSAGNWQQQFHQDYSYDRYGNRTINNGPPWGINNKQFTVDTATNRLGVPGGQSGTMTYDAAGNLITDTYTGAGAREYDAENKMTRAWGGNNQWQEYTYNADGQRTRRKIDGQETWQIYGLDGELVAEYPAGSAVTTPQKEYGYRNGELLVTAEAAQQSTENVSWSNAVGVSVSGNNLTKTAADAWGNSGASSSHALVSGDGYVELTASENTSWRMVGLSNGDSNQDYSDIDFAVYLAANSVCIYEAGSSRGCVSTYVPGDTIRVAVESGVLKYKKNGALVYTSSVVPTYPLSVDTALWSNGATISSVVLSGNLGSSSGGSVHWLISDQLGTPRMIVDQTGTLANIKRHDYLPFGEEIPANIAGRTPTLGYAAGDGVRQQFTAKERDIETGLDYFEARYYSSIQGRFTSPDEFTGGPHQFFVATGNPAKQAIPYADITQPQSLNKYSYVYNQPCSYIDPDGHCGTPSGLKPSQVGICVASYIQSIFVPPGIPPGRGDARGPNGQKGTSRIEVRLIVDSNGNVTKTDETMGRSGGFFKELGPMGTGGVRVSSPNKDEKGNVYFQINQHGESRIAGAVGSIDNHLNMVVTPDLKVGITPSSTAKDYPSLEVFKYTVDDKGKVTTTQVFVKTESGNMLDLSGKEKPIKADPQ